jgi:CxxC-x17-CxxC domain-containing protein
MSIEYKFIHCSNCLAVFRVNAEKQQLLQTWGYGKDLNLCPLCRRARKVEEYGTGTNTNRQMFSVVCAGCGKNTDVPFEPRKDRRVYCSQCYRKIKVG